MGHKSVTETNENTAIAKHFNKPNDMARNMEIGILDQNNDPKGLKIREATWIFHLKLIKEGSNQRDEWNLTLDPHTTNISNHYHHSRLCTPYFISHIKELKQKKLTREPTLKTDSGHGVVNYVHNDTL